MVSVDPILIYDSLLQNEPFFHSGSKKEALNVVCKGTYAGIRSYMKCVDEKKVQTGKWWRCLF